MIRLSGSCTYTIYTRIYTLSIYPTFAKAFRITPRLNHASTLSSILIYPDNISGLGEHIHDYLKLKRARQLVCPREHSHHVTNKFPRGFLHGSVAAQTVHRNMIGSQLTPHLLSNCWLPGERFLLIGQILFTPPKTARDLPHLSQKKFGLGKDFRAKHCMVSIRNISAQNEF